MARGAPALWSALLGLPFVLVGGVTYAGQTEYPAVAGSPLIGFGIFVIVVGLYVHAVSPSRPRLADDEDVIVERNPTQRVALVKASIGMLLLVVTAYLFFFTYVPFVYPTVTMIVGLFVFSSGLTRYWVNSLTTYYLTTDRVIREYRLLSLVRQEIPHSKIRGVQERKSLLETLVGLGNIVVASGGGRSLEIRMKNMEDSEGFADAIRDIP